jgi:hypothetical protein
MRFARVGARLDSRKAFCKVNRNTEAPSSLCSTQAG